MFRNPFSFTGRIRRLEYALSYIIFIGLIILGFVVSIGLKDRGISIIFLFIVSSWFLLAQGAKRCHDMGESDLLQLIPFYAIAMIFAEGTSGTNKYGIDPKNTDINHSDKPRFDISLNLPEGQTLLKILNELMSIVLLNVLFIVVIYHYFKYYKVTLYLSVLMVTMLCFFLFLVFTTKGYGPLRLRPHLFRIRAMYAVLLYSSLRLYEISFLNSEFDLQRMLYELIYIFMILAITYVPFLVYPIILKINIIDD